MPEYLELPAELAELTFRSALQLRSDCAHEDGRKIAQRLQSLIDTARPRGIPRWQAAAFAAVALLVGLGWASIPIPSWQVFSDAHSFRAISTEKEKIDVRALSSARVLSGKSPFMISVSGEIFVRTELDRLKSLAASPGALRAYLEVHEFSNPKNAAAGLYWLQTEDPGMLESDGKYEARAKLGTDKQIDAHDAARTDNIYAIKTCILDRATQKSQYSLKDPIRCLFESLPFYIITSVAARED
jgi:hypothetical protein